MRCLLEIEGMKFISLPSRLTQVNNLINWNLVYFTLNIYQIDSLFTHSFQSNVVLLAWLKLMWFCWRNLTHVYSYLGYAHCKPPYRPKLEIYRWNSHTESLYMHPYLTICYRAPLNLVYTQDVVFLTRSLLDSSRALTLKLPRWHILENSVASLRSKGIGVRGGEEEARDS
jgi:hypothetical protein